MAPPPGARQVLGKAEVAAARRPAAVSLLISQPAWAGWGPDSGKVKPHSRLALVAERPTLPRFWGLEG